MTEVFQLRFKPVDRWHFHDGRPFNQADAGLTVADSVFPPRPHVLVAAARNIIARQLGWNGQGDWSGQIEPKLGTGLELPDKLRFGRYRLSIDDRNLCPTPLGAVQKDEEWSLARTGPVTSGLSAAAQKAEYFQRFGDPVAAEKPVRVEDYFSDPDDLRIREDRSLTEGMAGPQVPDVRRKVRVGVGLDYASKTVLDGRLYTMAFSEFCHDQRLALTIEVEAESDSVAQALSVLAGKSVVCSLGGKGRAAIAEIKAAHIADPTPLSPGRYLAWLLTPAVIDEGPVKLPAGLSVLAAATGRLERFAPWDRYNRTAWHWLLPAGACWEIDCNEPNIAALKHLRAKGLNSTDDHQSPEWAQKMGFGEVCLVPLGDT